MKKVISIFLTMTLTLSLAACRGAEVGGDPTPSVPDNSATSQPGTTTNESSAPEQSAEPEETPDEEVNSILIAYFSWSGNTEELAGMIQAETGGDLFAIEPETPYTNDYNTLLDVAQQEQADNIRPALATQVENWDQYDTIFVGYPNWWASIPMPIASFLEEYDFSGKTIIPFCSHGGGRFGQSLTAIAKLAPNAMMGEALSIHYSGGAALSDDVAAWLEANQIAAKIKTDAGEIAP